MMEKIQQFLNVYEGSEYEHRVKSKREYYGELARRMNEFTLNTS